MSQGDVIDATFAVAWLIITPWIAEASSEKVAMGHWLDGRVSMIVGTHTHIPTADARILAGRKVRRV